MKKGEILEGIVERVDYPAKGIVMVEDQVVVVKNTIPGQRIRFRITKKHSGKAEAVLLEVLNKAPVESGPSCSHFGVCGGCTYLSMNYEEQLALKSGQVKRLLDQVLLSRQGEYLYQGIKASPKAYEYRNKMEFSFGNEYKDGPLMLGLHRRGSMYDLVDVSDCLIVDEDYRQILKLTREFFANREISFFHKMTHIGYLRHLLVRKAAATGEILLALVTSSQIESRYEESILQEYREALLKLETEGKLSGSFAGILHIVNDSLSDVVKSDETKILYGKTSFYEKLLGLTFEVSPFSFFQTTSYSAEVLYDTVREYVGKTQKGIVYDLYSGTGTITQLLSPVATKVIGVEIVEEAVEAAKESAKANGLHNVSFLAGDVLKVLDEIQEKPDYIVLDPPRDGIHPKALQKIIQYQVNHIVYISCKTTSLVRDLEVFLGNEYYLEKAVAVDQFPWTANIEVVALLKRKTSLSQKEKGEEDD